MVRLSYTGQVRLAEPVPWSDPRPARRISVRLGSLSPGEGFAFGPHEKPALLGTVVGPGTEGGVCVRLSHDRADAYQNHPKVGPRSCPSDTTTEWSALTRVRPDRVDL